MSLQIIYLLKTLFKCSNKIKMIYHFNKINNKSNKKILNKYKNNKMKRQKNLIKNKNNYKKIVLKKKQVRKSLSIFPQLILIQDHQEITIK